MVACPGRALAVRPSYCPVMFRANNGPSHPKNRKRSFCRELVENRKNSFDPGRQTPSRRVPRFAATERRLAPTAPDDAGSSPRARRRARGAGAAGVGKKAASTED